MAGFNMNKYQWEALYQANPVIFDPKLSHPVEREDGHGDHPGRRTPPRAGILTGPVKPATTRRPPRPALSSI